MKSLSNRIEALEREVKPGRDVLDITAIFEQIAQAYGQDYAGGRILVSPDLCDQLTAHLIKIYGDYEKGLSHDNN